MKTMHTVMKGAKGVSLDGRNYFKSWNLTTWTATILVQNSAKCIALKLLNYRHLLQTHNHISCNYACVAPNFTVHCTMQLLCCTLDNTIKLISLPKIMHGVTTAIDTMYMQKHVPFRKVVYIHTMHRYIYVVHMTT